MKDEGASEWEVGDRREVEEDGKERGQEEERREREKE